MKITSRLRWICTGLLVVVAALATACGGGSSVTGATTSPGNGSATIQGQVVASQTASTGESVLVVALRRATGVGVAEAIAGAPASGALVELLQGGSVVASTTAGPNGQFSFRDVAPGVYTVRVTYQGKTAQVAVEVGADDQAIVGVATTGASEVQVTAISTDVYNNDAQLGHAVNIDNASGSCDLQQVTNLRQGGMGWGDIARRCGVPPSVLGLGRSNLSDDDLDDARERTGHERKHASRGGGKGKGKDKS